MKSILLLLIIWSVSPIYGQEMDYGGVYSYGPTGDSGRLGTISVYPDSDSTLLFYLELNSGGPSFNNGAIVGQMIIYSPGEADFTLIDESRYLNCSMNFWFTNDSLYVRTNNQTDDCGYGHGVYSSGDFKRVDSETPQYFIDGIGGKMAFRELDWRAWWD